VPICHSGFSFRRVHPLDLMAFSFCTRSVFRRIPGVLSTPVAVTVSSRSYFSRTWITSATRLQNTALTGDRRLNSRREFLLASERNYVFNFLFQDGLLLLHRSPRPRIQLKLKPYGVLNKAPVNLRKATCRGQRLCTSGALKSSELPALYSILVSRITI